MKITFLTLMLITVMSVTLFTGCQHDSDTETAGQSTVMGVRTASIQRHNFTESLCVQGTIAAINRAEVAARIPGTLDAIFVTEGTAVTKGQPLFQTDKINLENVVTIESQNLRVAEAAVHEAEAALTQSQAAYEKASLDLQRFKQLFEIDQAVSKDTYERIELAHKHAVTGRARAEAAMTLVMARREQATTTLQIAVKQLSDSLVCSPYDGMVTKRMKEPGEFVNAGNSVVRVEDPDSLEVLFTLGEEWFTKIEQGVTPIIVTAGEREAIETVVAVRFPSVHPISRTFDVKALLPADGTFAPGMICDAEVVFAQHEGWGIKAEAIGRRSDQSVVFIVENGTAQQCVIKIGLRSSGYIEVLDGSTFVDQKIVIDGQAFLNHGMPVRVVAQD